jgi:hypothetical protein
MDVQEAGAAPATPAPVSKSLRTRRFWNWKLAAIELAIALLGFYAFNETTVRKPTTPGILGVLVGVVALWLLSRELVGISINSEAISMPTNRIPWLPVLSFFRRTVSLSDVRRLTVSKPWSGFDVVRISGDFGSDMLVFPSKGQRRRFIALMESLCPGMVVYRSRSLPD